MRVIIGIATKEGKPTKANSRGNSSPTNYGNGRCNPRDSFQTIRASKKSTARGLPVASPAYRSRHSSDCHASQNRCEPIVLALASRIGVGCEQRFRMSREYNDNTPRTISGDRDWKFQINLFSIDLFSSMRLGFASRTSRVVREIIWHTPPSRTYSARQPLLCLIGHPMFRKPGQCFAFFSTFWSRPFCGGYS